MNYLSNATLQLLIYFTSENNDGMFKLEHLQNDEIVQLIEELIDNEISENFVFEKTVTLNHDYENITDELIRDDLASDYGSAFKLLYNAPSDFLEQFPKEIEKLRTKNIYDNNIWYFPKDYLYIKTKNIDDINTKKFITKYLTAFIKDELKSESGIINKFEYSIEKTKTLLLDLHAHCQSSDFPLKIFTSINSPYNSGVKILESLLYFKSQKFIFTNAQFEKIKPDSPSVRFLINIHLNKKIEEWLTPLKYKSLVLNPENFTLKGISDQKKLPAKLSLFIKYFFSNLSKDHNMEDVLKIVDSTETVKGDESDKNKMENSKNIPFIKQRIINDKIVFFLTTRTKNEIEEHRKKHARKSKI